MGFRKPERWPPEQWRAVAETVATVRRCEWLVTTRCRTCRIELVADLAMIALKMGPNFSLWNRTSRCKVKGCSGTVDFWAQPPAIDLAFRMAAGWPPGSPHPRPPGAT